MSTPGISTVSAFNSNPTQMPIEFILIKLNIIQFINFYLTLVNTIQLKINCKAITTAKIFFFVLVYERHTSASNERAHREKSELEIITLEMFNVCLAYRLRNHSTLT